ncbi:MAG: Hpt domain-containing protein, partial [Spirochaetota bacterium]
MFDSDSTIMLETLDRMLSGAGPGTLDGPDVDRAFRAAHSIKSEAGFLNLTGVAAAAHRLEDALSDVRAAGGTVDEAAAASLHSGLRSLSEALERYRDERAGPAVATDGAGAEGQEPTSGAVGRTDAGRTGAAELGMLREARQRGEHLYRVSVSLDSLPEMRYARAFLVVNNLELSCAVIRSDPSLDAVRESGCDRMTLLVTSLGHEDVVHDAVERAVHVDEVELIDFSEIG